MAVLITAATHSNREYRKFLDSWSYSRKVCIRCKEIFEGRRMVRMCNSCKNRNNKIWAAIRQKE